MIFKIVAFLACCTLVLGFNIDDRVKRQVLKIPTPLTDLSDGALSSIASGFANGLTTSASSVIGEGINKAILAGSDAISKGIATAVNAGSDLASMGLEAVKAIGGRVKGAINNTYKEEINSIGNSWDSVKGLIHKNVETASKLTKTLLDLGAIGPHFGKNLLG